MTGLTGHIKITALVTFETLRTINSKSIISIGM